MEEKPKINESLIDQLIDEFINECLSDIYELKHTDIIFHYSKLDFYLKGIDLLRPKVYIMENSYHFNKHLFLTLNMNNIQYYCSLGKDKLFKYLNDELSKSKTYQTYLKRLDLYKD